MGATLKVLYEKHNGFKRFVIVDGAMNDLIRQVFIKHIMLLT